MSEKQRVPTKVEGGRGNAASDPLALPEGLPVPEDDGAADHLESMRIPTVTLPSTSGGEVDVAEVSKRGRVIVFCYPLTGAPGVELPEDWDLIPGARGCTPEACSFRDHHDGLRESGAETVFGLSTQTTEYQMGLVERLHLPFEILSDSELALVRALRPPIFEVESSVASQPTTLVKRLTLVLLDGGIEKVFYPIFPPNEHAGEVVAWLSENPAQPREWAGS
jgi:peroxiredoxin